MCRSLPNFNSIYGKFYYFTAIDSGRISVNTPLFNFVAECSMVIQVHSTVNVYSFCL